MTAAEASEFIPGAWHRLSPWSILHFAEKAVVQNVRALIFGGAFAGLQVSRWDSPRVFWWVPIAILLLVLVAAVITYLFYRYRVLDDSIQVRRGALFKKHLNLSFDRIQNISVEHPYYFRPIGRVTLKIDGAGSKDEEVSIAALELTEAEAARHFIVRRKQGLEPLASAADPVADESVGSEIGDFIYSRSVADLIVHGLTNNRSFIAVAAILGFLAQSGLSPADIAQSFGIEFDVVIAGLSLVRLVVLAVVAFIAAIGMIALLSVLVSIFTYFGFSMYGTDDSLTIRRGLLTKHEIHVKKSRIQTIQLRQDWLDRLLGRHNIILERITHSQSHEDPWAGQKSRIFIPSARVAETTIVTDQILPGIRLKNLNFTPINIRYFYKRAGLISLAFLTAFIVVLNLPAAPNWIMLALGAAWPLSVLHAFLRYKQGGLAIEGDFIIARSGAIGTDYRLFTAAKVQDMTHIQSILMRRHDLSSLRLHTASTSIKVPHMPSDFIRKVVDFCAWRVESTPQSWM